jgi:hypothetical protein
MREKSLGEITAEATAATIDDFGKLLSDIGERINSRKYYVFVTDCDEGIMEISRVLLKWMIAGLVDVATFHHMNTKSKESALVSVAAIKKQDVPKQYMRQFYKKHKAHASKDVLIIGKNTDHLLAFCQAAIKGEVWQYDPAAHN